jgi:hypothetical protein
MLPEKAALKPQPASLLGTHTSVHGVRLFMQKLAAAAIKK